MSGNYHVQFLGGKGAVKPLTYPVLQCLGHKTMSKRGNNMTEQNMCRKCVLPESTLFQFDDNGACELCNSPDLFKHIVKKPDVEKLNHIIERIRQNGTGHEYDCIVAWSGGRDSTFLLYELVT
jgi:hypothetical protein